MFDSSFRYGVSSFRRFGSPILLVDSLFSEVDSANCQFDSSSCQFDSSAGLVCRFVVSPCRFVVSTRPLRGAIIRRKLHEVLLNSMHLYMTQLFIICSVPKMDSLKSYLRHSIEFVLNRLNEQFHDSENGTGYLVTHLDRVLYILARASSLFNIPTQLECLLQRAHEMVVVLGGDNNSSQRRLFKFTGCRGRPSIDIPRELLEQYLENNFTPEQIARLFCVSSKTIRRRIMEYQLHFEKHSSLTDAELDDVM